MNRTPADGRESVFGAAKWIWAPEPSRNEYVLFAKRVDLGGSTSTRLRIAASYHYELFVDGRFLGRGPIHGDPKWCRFDEYTLEPTGAEVDLAVLVHHSSGTYLQYQTPAPGGLIAEIRSGDRRVGTDASWRCLTLPMWREDTPPRGWALDYIEDYDARLEPPGWREKVFPPAITEGWPPACIVEDPDAVWDHYEPRPIPMLVRRLVTPRRFRAFRAPGQGAEDVGDISMTCDEEPLEPVGEWEPYSAEGVNARMTEANAFLFDLGAEHVGFHHIDLNAPGGRVLDISGSELLRDGRPWTFRKTTTYSLRYRTRDGEQRFTSFAWSGFRYLYVVFRGSTEGVELGGVGCIERRLPLECRAEFTTEDETLRRVFDLCRRTLEVGVQEHLIDCPTREQAQYWGDALFIAESLWVGFDDRRYLELYLDGFVHAPLTEEGQVFACYPGGVAALVDYSLIPLLGQRFHHDKTGRYFRPAETLDKALRLKVWYDARLDADGLIDFDFAEYKEKGYINFIDHPGIGWHNFPHVGIDREGASCPLNTFYYGFLTILAEMAAAKGRAEAGALASEAARLRDAVRRVFYDGEVLHDAAREGALSEGTSWQTNGLAVFLGVIDGEAATRCMRAMLDGYDRLCRCSPYFHFYFLPALRMAGLEAEAVELIKREWRPMLDGDATTTWEGFLGDERDTLCHPWSTAPFMFLLGGE